MLEKAYDPKPVEAKWADRWKKSGVFHAEPAGDRAKRFVVVIPPPNVTGALHIGHALNNTLQDVLVRFHRIQGRPACWVPGTDHGGIATQNVMEKQLKAEKKSRRDLGREAFLERMQAWTRECKSTILGQLARLGCALDWSREAFTMDEPRSRAVERCFQQLWERRLLYRGYRMVNWCVRCGTALSDIEVEHEDRKGKLWHIRYPLVADPHKHVIVATTRPETMLGDTAVAVHPDDDRYKAFVGKRLRLPLTGHEIPVVADAAVDSKFGTGAVKVTPAHDPNDFEIWQRHPEIGSREVISLEGKMTAAAGDYLGLSREAARDKVVADLAEREFLVKTEDHPHAVGTCYRCQSTIEPMLSWQWFVKMEPLAVPALQAHEDGRFRLHPESWSKPYSEWLKGIRDWNVSRQIWWGHRIPVWYCGECVGDAIRLYFKNPEYDGSQEFATIGEVTTVAKLLAGGRSIGEIQRGAEHIIIGVDASHGTTGIAVQADRPGPCSGCGKDQWLQDPDVLDTWFSSALWPLSVFGWPEETKDLKFFYPTSVLVTGYEILYLWVARMQMMGLFLRGEAPFHSAVIHGIVRDKSGKKMSKSLGNVVDPLVMMDKYGTDAFRFSLAAQAHPGRDIPFAEESITGARNFANKLWNSTRFVLMNLPAESPKGGYRLDRVPESELELADRWILDEYRRTLELARARYDAFEVAGAADVLYGFLWDSFCDWYVELAKIRLTGPDGPAKEAARTVLVEVLLGTLKWLHPIMPFITEELYQAVKAYGGEGADSILASGLPVEAGRSDAAAAARMRQVMEVVTALRTLRAQLNVPPGLKIKVLAAGAPDKLALVEEHRPYVSALARLEDLGRADGDKPAHSAAAIAAGLTLYVPLEGVIDFGKERQRLQKEAQEIVAQLERCRAQLSNQAFLQRAPQQEVETIRRRQQDFQSKQTRIEEILRSLGS